MPFSWNDATTSSLPASYAGGCGKRVSAHSKLNLNHNYNLLHGYNKTAHSHSHSHTDTNTHSHGLLVLDGKP